MLSPRMFAGAYARNEKRRTFLCAVNGRSVPYGCGDSNAQIALVESFFDVDCPPLGGIIESYDKMWLSAPNRRSLEEAFS